VGPEADKFTPFSEARARALIRELLKPGDVVVSGKCHKGGIDKWSIEEAINLGHPYKEHPPSSHDWTHGYKPRNKLIARDSHRVVCITVRKLPPGYQGVRYPFCHHCGTADHVKSGGCWTVRFARELGKEADVIVIEQAP